MASHLRAGKEAENRAVDFLESKGIQIIERNFRAKRGEIDIVCQEEYLLVFVEVRWRSSNAFGGAIASLTPKKIQRMQLAASFYLQYHECHQPCRLDLLSQVGHPSTEWEWVRGLL